METEKCFRKMNESDGFISILHIPACGRGSTFFAPRPTSRSIARPAFKKPCTIGVDMSAHIEYACFCQFPPVLSAITYGISLNGLNVEAKRTPFSKDCLKRKSPLRRNLPTCLSPSALKNIPVFVSASCALWNVPVSKSAPSTACP